MTGRRTGNPRNRKIPVSLRSIQESKPDSFYLFKKIAKASLLATRDAYNSIIATFSLDHITYYDFKRVLTPVFYAGIAYIIGESVTNQMSRYASDDSEEYAFVFKFIIGAAILANSAAHRITEERIASATEYRQAVVSEILAVVYLYSSTYHGSRVLLNEIFSDDNYSLILSLAASTMIVPGAFAYSVKKYQENEVKKLYAKGAQLSATATISSGRTPFANTYFQANYYMVPEITSFSRIFQLGLISDNILNAKKVLQQFRNVLPLGLDVIPPMMKKMIAQRKKINEDYKNNTSLHPVLKFTNTGNTLSSVPRNKLRTGDLVLCDEKFDVNSSPLSGEIYAFKQDQQGGFTQEFIEEKYSINLVTKNGEPNWIELTTKLQWLTDKKVGLKEVHDERKPMVLSGTKLNLRGHHNFFVRIKEEKDRTVNNHEEKTALINQIIAEHKRNTVIFAILSSIVTAYFISNNYSSMPAVTLRLLFNVAQMMIAFSESVLREMINSKLLKELNQNLPDNPMETMDAMRAIDLCNTLGGNYYKKQCPLGPIFFTDKTGTLTTLKMEVRGIWTQDMDPDVQSALRREEKKSEVMPEGKKLYDCFETFCYAYTNSNKSEEPEEHALLQMFNKKFGNENCLTIKTLGNNYFEKTISYGETKKVVETRHLGLFRKLGGRFTLVKDGKDKYLVFFGIPKFKHTNLYKVYSKMQTRTQVLSRDWCGARAKMLDEITYQKIIELFNKNKEKEIEAFINSNPKLLAELNHDCTFNIDNLPKEGAETFFANCKNSSVPVPAVMVTGDNIPAAINAIKTLSPETTREIITIQSPDDFKKLAIEHAADTTVIFAGVNDAILCEFDKLMSLDIQKRPLVAFAEMSPAGKGMLAKHAKQAGYFVITMGDGTNDVEMMRNSHFAFSHETEDGKFAKDVRECSDLSEGQLQKLLQSPESFFKLFDIHLLRSKLLELFSALANTQEKSTIALLLKSSKMGFEGATALGAANVIRMPNQDYWSMIFDSVWFIGAYLLIKNNTELPMDKKNLTASNIPLLCMLGSLSVAAFSALYNYFQSNEATNLPTMLIFLGMFLVVTESLFNRYGAQRDLTRAEILAEEKDETKPSQGGIFSRCRSKRLVIVDVDNNTNNITIPKQGKTV